MRLDGLTLNEAIEDYEEIRFARYSESTWEAHRGQLEAFRSWVSRPAELGPNCLLRDLDERTMTRYFNRLRPPVLAGSSFNNYRQYLAQFFKWCLGEGLLQKNPMRHVDPAPVVRKPRLQLSAQELLMMLEDADPRDRMALALGMNTALRAGDLTRVKVGDCNLSNSTLEVFLQKPKKYDTLPMTADLRAEILRWLPVYAENQGLSDWMEIPNDWILVPPGHYEAVNVWDPAAGGRVVYKPHHIYTHPEKIVHRALEKLGHPTHKEGFHTLRRSTARRIHDLAVEEGVSEPIRIAQALLGHQRRETTEIYLGLTVDKQLRDDLLQGKSFLRRVADAEVRKTRAASEVRDVS